MMDSPDATLHPLSTILDDSTRLYSNLGFHFFANRLLDQARSSVLMIALDIDHLNQIRLSFGPDVSHAVVVVVANTIRKRFPSHAVAGRLNSDEFAVLMQAPTDPDETIISSFKLMLQENVRTKEFPFSVTVAIGTARSDSTDRPSLPLLLSAALKAAIRQKTHRR